VSERKLIKVEDVMNQDYVLVDGMITVAEALKVLRERRAHHLIVNRRHKYDEFGIVVLADIAKEVLAGNRSPDRVNVYEVMSKPQRSGNGRPVHHRQVDGVCSRII